MRKILAVFLTVCLLTSSPAAWADYWNEGNNGTTEARAYLIDSNEDLSALRDRVNNGTEPGDKYYKLMQNLSITGDWRSIGYYEDKPFSGHFDGNGKSIHVNLPSYGSYIALFRFVRVEEGTYAVKNLTVSGQVVGSYSAAGIIVKLISGNVENCTFTGTVYTNYYGTTGGIVAEMSGGKISECKATGITETKSNYSNRTRYMGGIAGLVTGGIIENCQAERFIIANTYLFSGSYAGGIVGYSDVPVEAIRGCTFSGAVTNTYTNTSGTDNYYAGGIVGYAKGGTLQNNHVEAQSAITCSGAVGGIAGRIGDSTVLEDCNVSNSAMISGGSKAIGGIVCLMNVSTVSNNFSYAAISGDIASLGGVVGKLDAAVYTISNNIYNASIAHGIGSNNNGEASDEGCAKAAAKITITTGSPLKEGAVKASYSVTFQANGGILPYTWTVSKGTLPVGLKLVKSTGKLSGKPKTAGNYSFTIKVTGANKKTATKAFKLTITKPVISGTLPNGVLRAAYTATLTATGGTKPYKWTISKGSLHTGLALNSTNGKITGKPTKTGTFKFTVKVTDKNKVTATKAYTVKVTKTAMSGGLTTGTIEGYSYYGNLTVSGGTAAYKWTISKGKLPTGLKLTYSGTTATISGTPTTAGTFSFTVKVTDKNSVAATKAFSVYVVSKSLIQTATKNVKSASATVKATSSNKKTSQSFTAAVPNIMTNNHSNSQGNGTITLAATLNVASDDVIETYEGKDSDLVKVKANTELTFIIGEWGVDVSELTVYVDDKPVEGLTVEEGKFTLTTEMVHGDFKVSVKAQSDGVELESEEVYIISE